MTEREGAKRSAHSAQERRLDATKRRTELLSDSPRSSGFRRRLLPGYLLRRVRVRSHRPAPDRPEGLPLFNRLRSELARLRSNQENQP